MQKVTKAGTHKERVSHHLSNALKNMFAPLSYFTGCKSNIHLLGKIRKLRKIKRTKLSNNPTT